MILFERNRIYLNRFFFIVLIIFLLIILTSVVITILSVQVFNIDIANPVAGDQHYANIMKILQVISMAGIFGFAPFIVAKFFRFKAGNVFLLNKTPAFRIFLFSTVFFVAILPFLQWLVNFNESLQLPSSLATIEQWMRQTEDKMAEQMRVFLQMESISDLVINILVIAIIPAFFEELFFRGLIQSFLLEWLNKKHLSVFLTSLIFSAVHFQFLGFLPRLMLGMVLGYFVVYSRSLWPSIYFHFLNNLLSIVLVYLQNKNLINPEFEKNMSESYLFVIVSLAIVAGLFLYFAFYFDKKRDKSKDWVIVFQTTNPKEAEIIQGKLENNEIASAIINKQDSSFIAFGNIEVMVQPDNVEKAKKIIDEEFNIE